jgi:hypothetical protein
VREPHPNGRRDHHDEGAEMKRMFSNGRYANVTATLALIIALGGTSYAAIVLPANSVGSKQLKKRAVTHSKLRANAVTSSTVRNGSLRAKDFKAGQLPAGSAGPVGPAGATNIVRRRVPSPGVAAGASGFVNAACNAGERAITGGLEGDGSVITPTTFLLVESFPRTTQTAAGDVPTGWYVEARNVASASAQFLAFVVCARP